MENDSSSLDVLVRDYEPGDYAACRSLLDHGPVARNVDAIQRFHAAGFRTLGGHVDLTMDLAERCHDWREGAHLHGLDFRY